jgi:CrcB protein
MLSIFLVGLGGFIGSGLRYAISILVYKLLGTSFPYGTFVVNVLGSLLIVIFKGLVESSVVVSSNWRLFVAIGLLGGFTTFSSFSYETIEMLKRGAILVSVINVSFTFLSCLSATLIGNILVKSLIK